MLTSVRERESKFIARYLNRKVGRWNSSLMEVHEEKCNSKTLTVCYAWWQPDEYFIKSFITAQKNAKELNFWQLLNKMNDSGNALQLASSHKVFQNYWIENFCQKAVPSVSQVQEVEDITRSTALESIFGSKVPAWSEPWWPTIWRKIYIGGRPLPNQLLALLFENLIELSKAVSVCQPLLAGNMESLTDYATQLLWKDRTIMNLVCPLQSCTKEILTISNSCTNVKTALLEISRQTKAWQGPTFSQN